MGKKLSKYIASLGYFGKSVLVLSATYGSISIASFATVTGAPSGIPSASLTVNEYKNCKKSLKATWNKSKKYNKIVMLARSKLKSIESKISEALISNEIGHEDFTIIINEKL